MIDTRRKTSLFKSGSCERQTTFVEEDRRLLTFKRVLNLHYLMPQEMRQLHEKTIFVQMPKHDVDSYY